LDQYTIVLQGNVSTRLRCDGTFNGMSLHYTITAESKGEKVWKSVNICRSYGGGRRFYETRCRVMGAIWPNKVDDIFRTCRYNPPTWQTDRQTDRHTDWRLKIALTHRTSYWLLSVSNYKTPSVLDLIHGS